MGRLDLAVGDLAALFGQAIGREVLRVDEVAIGGADRSRRELSQPGPVLQSVRQLEPTIGLGPAFRRFQQTTVAPVGRTARQGVHDFEHLFGVVLVRHQAAHGAQGADRLNA
ncbi:hypothetical protein D3C86_1758210 [compost metagenome]